MKYLTPEQSIGALTCARAVEQWLPSVFNEDYTVLRWLRIEKTKHGECAVQYITCFDDGDDDFIDISEFSPVNPDEPLMQDTFGSADDALGFAVQTYQADLCRFVGAGMIQEEYKGYLKDRR